MAEFNLIDVDVNKVVYTDTPASASGSGRIVLPGGGGCSG